MPMIAWQKVSKKRRKNRWSSWPSRKWRRDAPPPRRWWSETRQRRPSSRRLPISLAIWLWRTRMVLRGRISQCPKCQSCRAPRAGESLFFWLYLANCANLKSRWNQVPRQEASGSCKEAGALAAVTKGRDCKVYGDQATAASWHKRWFFPVKKSQIIFFFICANSLQIMGDPLNLSSILSEMMDVDYVVGCGFGDRNGLTLVLEGQISRYFLREKKSKFQYWKKRRHCRGCRLCHARRWRGAR